MTLRPTLRTLLLVLPLAGCDRCKPPDPEPDVDTPVDVVQDVDTKLQIVSIDPSLVPARQAFEGRVYGGGFAAGAQVRIGDVSVTSVEVRDENTLAIRAPGLMPGTWDVVVSLPDGTKSTLRQGLTVSAGTGAACRDLVVYFEFDKAGLSSVAKNTLDGAVPCYQAGTGPIRVEGHADERGTTDYNLALGQRRADTVSRHLTGQGVSGKRISTVSYGEERPVVAGHDESAWSKNRRVELHASE